MESSSSYKKLVIAIMAHHKQISIVKPGDAIGDVLNRMAQPDELRECMAKAVETADQWIKELEAARVRSHLPSITNEQLAAVILRRIEDKISPTIEGSGHGVNSNKCG